MLPYSFSPLHIGFSLLGSKQRKTLAQRSGQARWPVWTRKARKEWKSREIQVAKSPEAPLPPSGEGAGAPPFCSSRFTKQEHGTQGSPNRQTAGPESALQHVSFVSSWHSSETRAENQPGGRARKGSCGEGVGEREEGTHRAFSLVASRCRSHPSYSPQPFRRTHFRKRAEEAGWWGGVKMAAPLRIQSDWAQALRWIQI